MLLRGNNGFTSIPQSIYLGNYHNYHCRIRRYCSGNFMVGKIISSLIMLMGYSIIAVPTGILTVEMSRSRD